MVKRFVVVISRDRCTDCGICIDSCPEDVYDFDSEGRVYVRNEENCKGCRTCVQNCLCNAITLHSEKES